jgi:hypothetical protein
MRFQLTKRPHTNTRLVAQDYRAFNAVLLLERYRTNAGY